MAVNWLLSVLSRLLSAKRSAFHLLVYVHFHLRHRPYFCLSWCTLSSPPLDMLITSSLSAAQFIYWFRCYDKRRGSKCNPYFTPVNFLSWWDFCILIFTAAVKKLTKLRRDLCRPACIHVCPTFFLNNCSSTWHQACIAEDTEKGSSSALGRYLNPRHSDDVGADNSIEDFS